MNSSGNTVGRPPGHRLRHRAHAIRPIRERTSIEPRPGGFVVGYDPVDGPVVVRMFRPAPTRFYVNLSPWAVRLILYRSIAIAADIVVVTAEGQYGRGFEETVRAAGGSISFFRGEGPRVPPGTPYRPSLIVNASPHFDELRHSLGEWQTVFSLQARATPPSVVRSLRSYDGALLQRVNAGTADAVRQAYALDSTSVEPLVGLGAESLAVALPRRLRVAELRPTQVEREAVSIPRHEPPTG